MLFGICIFGENKNTQKLKNNKILSYETLDNLDINELDLTDIKNGFTWELDIKKKDLNSKSIKNLFGLLQRSCTSKDKLQQINIDIPQIENKEQNNSLGTDEIIDIFKQKVPKEWKDPKTRLIWEVKNMDNYENLYNYNESLEYAKSLNRNFYSGSNRWRVPTIDELLTLGNIHLFDYREKSSKFNAREAWKRTRTKSRNGKVFAKKIFSGIMNKQLETWYWSISEATPFSDNEHTNTNVKKIERFSESAWSINFFEGGNYHNNKDQRNHVICVRTSLKH